MMLPPGDLEDDNLEYLGRFDLDNEGLYSADIYFNVEDEPLGEITFGFENFFAEIGFDPYSQENLADLLTLSLSDNTGADRIDISSPDVRGAYDKDEAIAFMNHTGFWGLALLYYDEDFDVYYVDVEDVSG